MQEDEYTFVTIDDDDSLLSDAVVIDMDSSDDLWGVVMIDEGVDASDFITLSDDTIMLSDADMIEFGDMSDMDISFLV